MHVRSLFTRGGRHGRPDRAEHRKFVADRFRAGRTFNEIKEEFHRTYPGSRDNRGIRKLLEEQGMRYARLKRLRKSKEPVDRADPNPERAARDLRARYKAQDDAFQAAMQRAAMQR